MNAKKLTKAHLLFLARRRKRRHKLPKIHIVNLDPRNTVEVEMKSCRREKQA